jgi:uncharacterized membrane protein YadS
LWTTDDWWAVWLGGILLACSFLAVYAASGDGTVVNPLAAWCSKVQSWESSPADAFAKDGASQLPGIACVGAVSLVLFGAALRVAGGSFGGFARGFVGVFLLTVLGLVLASQATVLAYNLEYPLWTLLAGLLVSNTTGTPAWIRPAVRSEFYLKTGLVLLGATILLGQLLTLGVPGMFVSWVVTPVVLVATYWFGQRVLQMGSRTLNITISADMSVCGVSAAIATAAACRAKKEELSLAIALSLGFTVVMMIVMPAVIRATGMSQVLGGAWIGGTIDATGAVAAAGAFVGETAEKVAVTVKMIQNILIGVIAFAVAVYWVLVVESDAGQPRPTLWEIWYRFPKFVLGFVGASVVFTALASGLPHGDQLVHATIRGTTDVFRGWFFGMAFVCIGLETNVRQLLGQMEGGKPLALYVVGQCFNLVLTLAMAWLMFEVVFPQALEGL